MISIAAYRAFEASEVPHPDHRTRVMEHAGPAAAPVFLFFHGLHESPSRYEWLIDPVHAAGWDVVAVRLPGHWERRLTALDDLSHRQWLEAAELFLDHAAGRPLVVGGHSTGGYLAAHLALHHPALVRGLVLLAPALALAWPTRIAVAVGNRLPWLKARLLAEPDGRRIAYKSTRAALEVVRMAATGGLIARLERPEPLPPLLMVSVAHDTAVSEAAIETFFARYPNRTKQLLRLGPWQGYLHYSLAGHHPGNPRLAAAVCRFLADCRPDRPDRSAGGAPARPNADVGPGGPGPQPGS